MPLRLMHIIDSATHEDAARLCSLLVHARAGGPAGGLEHEVVALDGVPAGSGTAGLEPLARLGRVGWLPQLDRLRLTRLAVASTAQVIVAWGTSALANAARAAAGRPVLGVVTDPAEASAGRGIVLASRIEGIICTSQTVLEQFQAAGVPRQLLGIIRPAVDFGTLRASRQSMNRSRLNLPANAKVLLTPSPPTRAGGQFFAVWATALLHQLREDVHLVIPGTGREQQRLARLVGRIVCPRAYRLTGERFSPAELLSISDLVIAPARAEVSTGWLAWAMAAGVPIIGSPVASVRELIRHELNGLLCPPRPHDLATAIREALARPDMPARCAQTASGQAYEVFRLEGFARQFEALLHNLAARAPLFEGITDRVLDVRQATPPHSLAARG